MLPPGPRVPGPWQATRYLFRPLPFIEELHRRFGSRVTMRLTGLGTFVLLSEPDDAKRVLTAPADVLRGGEVNEILEPLVGSRSLLRLDGDEHRRERRLMLPPFHGERVTGAGWREVVAEATRARMTSWRPGQRLRLHGEFQAITLEVIARAVFGLDAGARSDRLKRQLKRVIEMTAGNVRAGVYGALMPLNRVVPLASLNPVLRRMDSLLFAELEDRARDPSLESRSDIASMLLLARDEDGRPISRRHVRDELVTLLSAGHDTTATALAWTFERLVRHPDAAERAASGDEEYVAATVHEGLRVRSVLPFTTRGTAVPFELDGLTVPAGVILCPGIHMINHRADLYPQPRAFRPERFLDRKPETYSWLPFGGGERRCLGASFAMMEMREVIATVLQTARLRPVDPRPEGVRRRGITLAPRRGALVEVEALALSG